MMLFKGEVTKETVVDGYLLEKGKTVYANIWSCVRDPAFWENPGDFDPYRFIDAQGKCINNHPALLVFGIGTRKCIGRERGRSETFLIFTSLMHTFRFELANRPETLDSITNYGITIFPSNILFQIERIVC
jgi:cytochrome P450